MTTGRSYAALQMAAVAAVCVLVGHWAGYFVAVPHANLRDAVLLESGHTYWVLAVKLAMLLGVVSLATGGLDALRRGLSGANAPDGWTLPRAITSLALIQVGTFSVLEVSERVLAGEGLADLFHHNVFAWGLLTQLLIAPIGGLLLSWLGRALSRVVTFVAALRRAQRRHAGVLARPVLAIYVPSRDWRGTYATRGPPALAA
jgi:hypothetical protein